MKKIKVKILGLSYSQSQIGSYVLVLSEIKGERKLPIIIKPLSAQYIALKMENIETTTPMTQDLFKNFTDALGADVSEVFIYGLTEGMFYCKVILTNAMDSYEIPCSVGDAISIAILYRCRISVSSSVMDSVGIYMSDEGVITEEQQDKNRNRVEKESASIESLENMLQKAVENEEYEIATQLRDRINQLKSSL
jgi:hypothetical protein